GHGTLRRRGLVSYFGGRLQVDYWFHDRLTTRVAGLETSWGRFHTRSGVHVGTSRQALRALHVICGDGECSRAGGRMPDAPGTVFTMRHGKVAQIEIFYALTGPLDPTKQPWQLGSCSGDIPAHWPTRALCCRRRGHEVSGLDLVG